jgi:alpha-glucoside transport system permease protein
MAAREEKENKSVIVTIVLLVICIAWTLPTIGLLVTSFRHRDVVSTTGWWTVVKEPNLTAENYKQVLIGKDYTYVDAKGAKVTARTENLSRAILNSLAVTIPAVVIPILIAAFAAYGFAWVEFPGRKIFFTIVVALLVVPLQIALIPILRDYLRLKLTGTFLAIWLAHTGFGLPLAIYLLFNYVSTIPRSILESAFIDGYTHFWIFIYLILPLSVPALASFAIFQFVWVWNDLLVAMVFLGTKKEIAVITQRLLSMIGTRGHVFLLFQKWFVRSVASSGIKG